MLIYWSTSVVYFDQQTGAASCHLLVEVIIFGFLSSLSITNRNKTGLQPVSRPVERVHYGKKVQKMCSKNVYKTNST